MRRWLSAPTRRRSPPRSLPPWRRARPRRERDLAGDAELICREGGNTLLTRTIRYVEDRRRAEDRYTGAIETHPSPLGVIWGSDDPIAVREMATRLGERRHDATVCVLEGVGHYPMLEAPDEFLAAASRMLEPV